MTEWITADPKDRCPRCGEVASWHIYEHDTLSTFCSDGRITPGEFWREVQRAAMKKMHTMSHLVDDCPGCLKLSREDPDV